MDAIKVMYSIVTIAGFLSMVLAIKMESLSKFAFSLALLCLFNFVIWLKWRQMREEE